MKKFLFTFLQFVLFLFTFAIGSFAQPFHIQTSLDHINASALHAAGHFFVWDGLLLTLGLYVLFLIVEVLRKKLRTSTPWTTLALMLAIGLGLVMKLGFLTREF